MELIECELKWKGPKDQKTGIAPEHTETVYFREMTGADQLALVEGQTYKGNPKKGEFEIDVATNVKSSQKLLLMTLVTAEGKPVYANLKQVQAETRRKLDALIKLANDVHKDDEAEEDEAPEAAGNA